MTRNLFALTFATLATFVSASSFADNNIALNSQGAQVATPIIKPNIKTEQSIHVDAPTPKSAFDPQINVRVGNTYPMISI